MDASLFAEKNLHKTVHQCVVDVERIFMEVDRIEGAAHRWRKVNHESKRLVGEVDIKLNHVSAPISIDAA